MSNVYRGIEFSVWEENFIKLFDAKGVKRDGRDFMRRGEAYVSIPHIWKDRPDLFAKRQIDMLHERMEYHENFEKRKRLK